MWRRSRSLQHPGALRIRGRVRAIGALAATAGILLAGCGQHPGAALADEPLAAPLVPVRGSQDDGSLGPRCESIPYLIADQGAPSGAVSDVVEAFARLEAATGIDFLYGGPTSERPLVTDPKALVEAGADHPRHILVAWVGPEEFESFQLHPETAGWGYGIWEKDRGAIRFHSGAVYLNSSQPRRAGFETRGDWGGVLLHELGHVMGLHHAAEPDELMFDEIGEGAAEWASRDLELLRLRAQKAGCHPGAEAAEGASS